MTLLSICYFTLYCFLWFKTSIRHIEIYNPHVVNLPCKTNENHYLMTYDLIVSNFSIVMSMSIKQNLKICNRICNHIFLLKTVNVLIFPSSLSVSDTVCHCIADPSFECV